MNVITITGRLTRDAEQKYLQSGTAILKFSVANNTGYGDKQKTNYFECAIFGKRAEGRLVEFLKKGQEVAVTGEIELNTYQKQDGTQGASLQVMVNSVDLIGGKPERIEAEKDYGPTNAQESTPESFNDDIPF